MMAQPEKINREKTPDQPSDEEDHHDTSCGIGSWRPAWLQFFASPMFFLLNLGLVAIIQGMTGTIFFSSMSTFEKRFAFDSRLSSIIMIADNFADMILNPIVGYWGIRYNRARMIAIGELILAFGAFLSASPYFIYGPATHLINSPDPTSGSNFTSNPSDVICSATNQTAIDLQCEVEKLSVNSGGTVWPAFFILVSGSFLRGMGYTCFFVLGLPYLDDNIPKKQSPIYISVIQALRLIGPAGGYLVSSFWLRFYENPFITPPFGTKDPRFVGAWWMSFVTAGSLLLFAAIPMLFFPIRFKNASSKNDELQQKMKENGGSLGALKRFFTNPVILLYCFGNIFRFIGIGGYLFSKAKYVESQFRQSSSSASFITGTVSFIPMAIGIFIGGFATSIFKPSPRTLFICVFLVESVNIFTVGSGYFLGCPQMPIQGAYSDSGAYELGGSCNADCHCSTRVFNPVCNTLTQQTFFSPCHAGCRSFDNSLRNPFSSCSCAGGESLARGYCKTQQKCDNFMPFITFLAAGNFISSFARTPNSLISLRSVEPMDKGFAIGIGGTLLDLLAFIPYPLIFGYIADSSCLIWESKCGKTGNCWVYDNEKFRSLLHSTAVFFLMLGSLFDFLMIFYSNRVQNFYDDGDSEDDDGGQKVETEKNDMEKATQNWSAIKETNHAGEGGVEKQTLPEIEQKEHERRNSRPLPLQMIELAEKAVQ